MITNVDIVKSQILIAEGYALDGPEIAIGQQDEIWYKGVAIQCRITTEDPQNNFMPDTGKIIAYRSGGGPGIRLDAGTAYTGAVITPYYDSLLVKVTAHALHPKDTIHKMLRCMEEFRISGVKTNIYFLQNMLRTRDFQEGLCDVNYIDRNPWLLQEPDMISDRGTKLLSYIGDITVNGYAGAAIRKSRISIRFRCSMQTRSKRRRVLGSCSMKWDRRNSPSGSWTRRKSCSWIPRTVMRTSLCSRPVSGPMTS